MVPTRAFVTEVTAIVDCRTPLDPDGNLKTITSEAVAAAKLLV